MRITIRDSQILLETGHFLHRRIQKDITETSGLPKNQECIHLRSWKWGETGKALYGTNAAGEPWLLLRSGGHLDAQVSLPDTTLEIWSQALEYTTTQSGRYTVNWENLGQLWIDSGAFYSSQLGGDITLSDSCYLASYAVYNCDQLTSVTMGDNIGQIGEGTFGAVTV